MTDHEQSAKAELAQIHRLVSSFGDVCPDEEDGDTLTVRYVKRLIWCYQNGVKYD